MQLTVQSHSSAPTERLKIIDCLLPGPLTVSRPLHTHMDRHTLPHASLKRPAGLYGAGEGWFAPGTGQIIGLKHSIVIWSLFFFYLRHVRLKYWRIGILFSNLFWTSHVHAVIWKPRPRKKVICDSISHSLNDLLGWHRHQGQTRAIMPKIGLDINICAPERRNVFPRSLNRIRKTINTSV